MTKMQNISSYNRKTKTSVKDFKCWKNTRAKIHLLRFKNLSEKKDNWKTESNIWNRRVIIGISFNRQDNNSRKRQLIEMIHKIGSKLPSAMPTMTTMNQSDPWWTAQINYLLSKRLDIMTILKATLKLIRLTQWRATPQTESATAKTECSELQRIKRIEIKI